MFKNPMDVQAEVLERELASRASSSSTQESTPAKQSDSPKSTDASVVKEKAGEDHDASSESSETVDGVSSYNRYREAQRKYEKSLEQIDALKLKLESMTNSEVKQEIKNQGLTEEGFRDLFEQDSSKAVMTALKQFSESIRNEVTSLIAKDKQADRAKHSQYIDTLKTYPELANLADPFTQAVDEEIKSMQAKKIDYPEMVQHAADIVYGRMAKAGMTPAQKAKAADEQARLNRISQGQTIGKAFGDGKDFESDGLTEEQVAYAKRIGINPATEAYKNFVKVNTAHFNHKGKK